MQLAVASGTSPRAAPKARGFSSACTRAGIALETKRKKLERDVREATGNTRASVRSRAQELLLGEARARLTAHIREKMTVFNEKTRIFNNEHFWFQYWEARVSWRGSWLQRAV